MQVIDVELSKLKEYENNPRFNDNAIEAVRNSIASFGFKTPIIIDKDFIIVAGHTRKKAAEALGLKTAPCIIADDLTEEQIKAFRLVDNKTAELAEWDTEKLELELLNINIDMSEFRFDKVVFDEFTTDFSLPEDDKPQTRTITLSLCEEQYTLCESVIDYFSDKIEHSYGNNNKRSNALFEAVYLWAQQSKLF